MEFEILLGLYMTKYCAVLWFVSGRVKAIILNSHSGYLPTRNDMEFVTACSSCENPSCVRSDAKHDIRRKGASVLSD